MWTPIGRQPVAGLYAITHVSVCWFETRAWHFCGATTAAWCPTWAWRRHFGQTMYRFVSMSPLEGRVSLHSGTVHLE